MARGHTRNHDVLPEYTRQVLAVHGVREGEKCSEHAPNLRQMLI